MRITVQPGHTLNTHGTLLSGQYLTVDGGNATTPGGVLIVHGNAVNDGFAEIDGSSSTSATGAQLIVSANATLTNNTDIIAGLGSFPSIGNGPTLAVDGTFRNNGLLRFGEGYPGGAPLLTIASTGTLTNAGTTYLIGGRPGGYAAETGATLSDAGVMTNSATLIVFGGCNGATYAGSGAQLSVSGAFTNTGVTALKGSYGGLRGQYQQGTGSALTLSGHFTNYGFLTVYAANSYGYSVGASGATISIQSNGVLTNDATLSLLGGAAANGFAAPAASLSIGSLGALHNYGVLNIYGGAPTAFAAYGGPGSTVTMGEKGFVFSFGTISIGAGQAGGTGGVLSDNGYLYIGPPGLVTIAGGPGASAATLTIGATGTLTDDGTLNGAGNLINGGYFRAGINGIVGTGVFINNATLAVPDFTSLTVTGPLYASPGRSGLIDLISGGHLVLDGSVAASQSFQFDNRYGNAMTLALGDAAGFAGTLDALGTAAVIDFLNLDITGAASTGTTLTADVAGGPPLTLALAAPLAAGTGFSLTSDGAGGTDLSLIPPATHAG